MRESEILSAIDSAGGELDEQVILSSVQGQGLVNVHNTLAKLRGAGLVKRVRHEDGLRTYVRVESE